MLYLLITRYGLGGFVFNCRERSDFALSSIATSEAFMDEQGKRDFFVQFLHRRKNICHDDFLTKTALRLSFAGVLPGCQPKDNWPSILSRGLWTHNTAMAVPLQLKFAPPRRRRASSPYGAQRVEYSGPPERYDGSFPRAVRNYSAQLELEGVPYSDRRSVDAEVEASLVSVPDPNARPKCFKNIYQECIFVFTVMMATASTTILQGVTVINTASIGKSLNMTAAEITWINAGLGYVTRSQYRFQSANTHAGSAQAHSCSSLERQLTSLGGRYNSSVEWLHLVSSHS